VSTDGTMWTERRGAGRRRVAVVPFGCKVSRIEAQAGASAPGAPPPVSAREADVVVLHGCAVTERAVRDQRRFLLRLRRENPGAAVIVSGCLARSGPETLARLPGVDVVDAAPPSSRGVFAVAFPDGGRTRAFLKIQDGCRRRCAFCVVPSLRGEERSADPREVADQIRRLGEAGVPETVLAGVHLAAFGRDRGTDLLALLSDLERDPPACRVRLSSLEPMEAGEALVDFVAGSRTVVPHLHLPLQSGSDAVLRRMRRGISAGRFRALSRRALRANPRLHLATDLIAGFPGETEAEFEETRRLVSELPFASLHVFPFSPRRGTPGAELFERGRVPPAVVTRRASALRRLGEEKARAFRRAADGTLADAVVLRGGLALTDHYLEASLGAPLPPGIRLPVRLQANEPGAVLTAVPAAEAGSIPPP